jgi:hypothetical protein
MATALLSVLVKQWLQAYASPSNGSAMERAKIRQFRFQGFQDWKVTEIIGSLSLVLHASLALFMAGLTLYVSELHSSLCWVVIAITGLSFFIYFGSIFIPAITIQCPYRIPLLFIPTTFLLFPLRILQYYWQASHCHFQESSFVEPVWPSLPGKSIRDAEIMFLKPDFRSSPWKRRHPLPSFNRHHSILAIIGVQLFNPAGSSSGFAWYSQGEHG